MRCAFIRLLFIFSFFLSLSPVGCGPDEPLKIGFIAGTSGSTADLGVSARYAAQMAVDLCNEQGGIGGRPVALVTRDDRHEEETAIRSVRDLIREGVQAIVGPASSQMATAIVPSLNESRVVAVGSTVTTPLLSGLDDYFLRVCSTISGQAAYSARYHLAKGEMHRISVAYDGGNSTFTKAWLEDFRIPFTAGGGDILTAVEFKVREGASLSGIARSLLEAGPDGVMLIANPKDSAFLCQQIRRLNPSVPITLSVWAGTRQFIELGGKAAEGATVPIVFDGDSRNPSYLKFKKHFRERYGRESGFPGFYAYNAAQVVLTALRARKPGQHLKETILSIGEFEGLQGKIRLDAYGDVKPGMASMRVVRDQKFVLAE